MCFRSSNETPRMKLRVEANREVEGGWIAEAPDLAGVVALGKARKADLSKVEGTCQRERWARSMELGCHRILCPTGLLTTCLATALLLSGCQEKAVKPDAGNSVFARVQQRHGMRVTLIRVEKRNVFLGPEGARQPNVEMQIVPGFSVAYVVEPIQPGATNLPVLLTVGKASRPPGPKDVPRGFNPAVLKSYWFDEYMHKFFPYSQQPVVQDPSNAIVYVSERYGLHVTNKAVDLAIEASIPTTEPEFFVFRNVPAE